MGCCFQDLCNTAYSILVQLPSSFFSKRLISAHVVHPYSSMDTTAACKKLHFILSDKSDLYMTDSLLIAGHAFAIHVLMSFRWDAASEVFELIRKLPFSVEMSPFWFRLKHMYSFLSALTWRPMPPSPDYAAWIRLCIFGLVYLPEVLCYQRNPRQ